MSKIELRDVVASQKGAIHQSFSQIPVLERVKVGWQVFKLQSTLIFSHKFIWFMVGVAAYLALMYAINYNEDMRGRLDQEDIIYILIFPVLIFSIFLNMQLVTSEKENRTLEIMFTTAGSRYKVWLIKSACLSLVLFGLSVFISAVAFFTFTEMQIFMTGFYMFIPGIFIGNLTLYFATRFRSGLAAGMVAGLFVFLFLMFQEPLEDANLHRFMLFFNPFDPPRRIDPETWQIWTWQNKIGYLAASLGLVFAAIRGMEDRERLLR